MSNASTQKVPSWLWLIAGAVLGALVVYLMGLSRLDLTPQIPSTKETVAPQTNPDKKNSEAKPERPQRTFTFYRDLSEQEVPVTATPAAERTTVPTWYYLIQVASFQSANDANDVRAKLLLKNFDAYTETSHSDSGTLWHRIMVGPFQTRSQMEKARSQLQAMRFNPMPIKRKIANE